MAGRNQRGGYYQQGSRDRDPSGYSNNQNQGGFNRGGGRGGSRGGGSNDFPRSDRGYGGGNRESENSQSRGGGGGGRGGSRGGGSNDFPRSDRGYGGGNRESENYQSRGGGDHRRSDRGGRGNFQGGRGGGRGGSRAPNYKIGPIDLTVNYYPVLLQKLVDTVYQYDIDLNPCSTKKLFHIAIHVFMAQNFPNFSKDDYAYDGNKILYTCQPLNFKGDSVEANVKAVLGDRSRDYKVTVKPAAKIDMKPLKLKGFSIRNMTEKPFAAIQALNVIVRKCLRDMIIKGKAVSCGSSVYVPEGARPLEDTAVDLWYGYFQSVIMGQKSIYLNVDVLHKTFPRPINLLQLITILNSNEPPQANLNPWMLNSLKEHLKRLEIEYKGKDGLLCKRYMFKDFGKTARDEKFEFEGRRISVLDYFQKQGKQLNYPNFPLVELGQKGMMVPMEWCTIPGGQVVNKKATREITSKMVRLCAVPIRERKAKIDSLFGGIQFDNDLKNFGISIKKEFEGVKGRVIDPPALKYDGENVKPYGGVWEGKNFLQSAKFPEGSIKWALFNFERSFEDYKIHDLKNLIYDRFNVKKIALQKDLSMNKPINFADRQFPNNFEKTLSECKKVGCKLIFVVLPKKGGDDCYAKVKQIAENQVGIMTQCIKANTMNRMNSTIIDNIILKDNAKLNGINHEIAEENFQKHPGMMFIGADVTHAGPDSIIPSIAGVASTYDYNGFKFCCDWSMQRKERQGGQGRQVEEMILDLESIVLSHLKRYQQFNSKLPQKILYYRDGVSEGQFDQVLQIEMRAIEDAVAKMMKGSPLTKPKITFIVVQKRHHARFFPMDQSMKNVPPGTVVDEDIVDPITPQFFLTSHEAIAGVARPSKYCILKDESKFTMKELEHITFDLCHMFARCNRSVSYPAPTYYAHLVAARGREYIRGAEDRIKDYDNKQLQREYQRIVSNNNAMFNDSYPMFFV